MNVLVLGDTGFIGAAVVQALVADGHDVCGVSRNTATRTAAHIKHLVADRNDVAPIADIAKDTKPDVLIDIAAYTVKTTTTPLDAIEGHVGRYVLLSSADVYRNYGLLHRREGGPIAPVLDEDSALRMSRFPNRMKELRRAGDPMKWMDDYDKIPIEDDLQARPNIEWTILRLPMVFGPGEKQHRFRWIIEPMLKRPSPLDFPRPWIEWRTTYGYIENIAAGIVLAAGSPRAANRIYNLGEAAPSAHSEWVMRFANAIPWRGAVNAGDRGEASLLAAVRQLDLRVMIVLSSLRIRDELGFSEPVPVMEAVARTAEAEKLSLRR